MVGKYGLVQEVSINLQYCHPTRENSKQILLVVLIHSTVSMSTYVTLLLLCIAIELCNQLSVQYRVQLYYACDCRLICLFYFQLVPTGILFMAFLMHVYFQPYEKKWDNWLETYTLLHFIVMMLLRSTPVSKCLASKIYVDYTE